MSTEDRSAAASGFWAAWCTTFLIWLAATASLEPARLVAGLLVTAGIARLAASRTTFWAGLDLSPARFAAGLGFLVHFLGEMVKSNLAVLRYVYAPRVDIAPTVIGLRTRLAGPRERLALTNSLTLTPGTMVVGLDGEKVRLHVLDQGLVEGTDDGLRRFETLLERAVG